MVAEHVLHHDTDKVARETVNEMESVMDIRITAAKLRETADAVAAKLRDAANMLDELTGMTQLTGNETVGVARKIRKSLTSSRSPLWLEDRRRKDRDRKRLVRERNIAEKKAAADYVGSRRSYDKITNPHWTQRPENAEKQRLAGVKGARKRYAKEGK